MPDPPATTHTPVPGVQLIGSSRLMRRVVEQVRRVARIRSTVLIRGQSGTGKEVVARAIHSLSGAAGRFVTVDCTNLPASLLESELFGHERGAFTDARSRKTGLLETADGGTVLLDEIGLMPIEMQSKLLNVLETQRFRRVGGNDEIQVDVRFLAATNEDLEKAVDEGRFREDLFYRLNVVPIDLPPLCERVDDIVPLAEHFVDSVCRSNDRAPVALSHSARELLLAYPWPGNVRELRNVIENAVLMSDGGTVRAEDLIIDRRSRREPARAAAPGISIPVQEGFVIELPRGGVPLDTIEREIIRGILEHARGNVTRAAQLLGVSRDTLRYRIEKHHLQPKKNGQEPG